MPLFTRPRSSSSPPPRLPRLHVKSLDLSFDGNWTSEATREIEDSTPTRLKVPLRGTLPPPPVPPVPLSYIAAGLTEIEGARDKSCPSPRKSLTSPTAATKARLDKFGVVLAWDEIISRNRSKISLSSEKRRAVSETVSSPQKKVLRKIVAEEPNKRRKRVVSLQLPLPSMSGHLGSWRSASNMGNTGEGRRECEDGERGRERQAKVGKPKAGSRTVGFGYESYPASTPQVPMPISMPESNNKSGNCSSRRVRRIREPEESWLDLDDSPASTIGRATPVEALSTMVVVPQPPVTPPSSTEASEAPKALVQTHLTTTLLSLEIDIAQLDTRLFLIFDQLRAVHTSLLLRIPGITMALSQGSPVSTPLKPISTAEGKSKVCTLRNELAALGMQITGYMETISIVEMQIVEAPGEKGIFAGGAVVVEDFMIAAGDLRGQVKTVKDELGRLERKRRGLGEWAGEVWVGWNFGAGEEEDVEGKTQVPVERTQSAPATPVSGPSYLTVPERSDVALGRNRSIKGSRSMGSIKINASSASSASPSSNRNCTAIVRRKPAPPNVNKPLPASPGDGDFEMETRYIHERSRSRSPAPPPLDCEAAPAWVERSTLLPPSPNFPRAPTIPERNPRRIVPRTGPPPEPELDVELALSVPSSSTSSSNLPPPVQTANSPTISAAMLPPQLRLESVNGRRHSFASITDSTRFSLDLTNLDQLITSSARRSPEDVYHDFFSTHSIISEDNSSYQSRYARSEDEALRQEWNNEEGVEGEFELPPLLPSIGPDSVFSSTSHNNKSSNKHNNRASIASSCDNSSTPTTPGSTSPATPYTPFTPFTSGPTFTPYTNPHQRCSYSIYRKPIPSAQASPSTIPEPSSPTKTSVSTATATTAATIAATSSSTSSQSPLEQTFTFYSPSSFPQPPALKDLERKVQRGSTLRCTAGWGANGADNNGQLGEYGYTYQDVEIELLQCPPSGIVYSAPVPPVPQPDPAPALVPLGSTPEKVGMWKRFGMKGGRDRDEGSHSQSQGHPQEWKDGSAGIATASGKEGKEGKRWSNKGMGLGKGMGKNAFWRIRGGSKDPAKEERVVKMFSV
ncbi:hypothetical protein BGX38DRAFT_698965 [Terfezia claveryi]|nr:hypothetical protein BGX38DRAFT_698965 [Terfezia claveryi]